MEEGQSLFFTDRKCIKIILSTRVLMHKNKIGTFNFLKRNFRVPGVQACIKILEMIYYVALRGYCNSFRDTHMTNMFTFLKKCLFR